MDDEEVIAFVLVCICLVVQQIIMSNQAVVMAAAAIRIREPVVKVNNFFEETVPNMRPRMFRRYFRMYFETLTTLTNFLSTSPILDQEEQYVRISKRKKIAMTCAYLGCTSPLLQLSHLFGVAEESFIRVTEEVIEALISRITQIINWPEENELRLVAAEFDTFGRFFPNVIGAIDGIHLKIKLTEEKPDFRSYFCWKQYYSIHLQAVATYDMRFLDIFTGWPGISHDKTFHIVGDSAFPLSPQLLTPFRNNRNNPLNDVQKKYNTHLSSKRNVVERAFALLLQRFPRVLRLNQATLAKKIKVVMSACVLHNICILEKDNIEFFLNRAQNRRFRPLNPMYRPLGTAQSTGEGRLKRLQMANAIFLT